MRRRQKRSRMQGAPVRVGCNTARTRQRTALAGDLAGCLATVRLRNHSPYPRTGSLHGPGVDLQRARGYRHNTGTAMTGEPTPFMDYWDAVDEAMLKLLALDTTDAAIEPR